MIAEEVSKKQKDCEEDLVKAEPALLAAQEALNTLNKVLAAPCNIIIQNFVILTGKFDGAEIVWFTTWGGDQRDGGGDGAAGARGQSAQGPQLEGGQNCDGQRERVSRQSHQLR